MQICEEMDVSVRFSHLLYPAFSQWCKYLMVALSSPLGYRKSIGIANKTFAWKFLFFTWGALLDNKKSSIINRRGKKTNFIPSELTM